MPLRLTKVLSQQPNECPSGRTIIPTAGRLFQRPDDCLGGRTITPAYHSGGRILPRIVTPVPPDSVGCRYGVQRVLLNLAIISDTVRSYSYLQNKKLMHQCHHYDSFAIII